MTTTNEKVVKTRKVGIALCLEEKQEKKIIEEDREKEMLRAFGCKAQPHGGFLHLDSLLSYIPEFTESQRISEL